MIKIALNSFGRIGKLALRRLFDNYISVEFINDKNGDPDLFAHLLEFDTVHGRWDRNISNDSVSLTVNNQKIPVLREENIANLPLDGIDIVIDCTGFFKS
jgi:glyceraldehyde 3-phosphate dehydrogenase